ncbi:hypothetical protein Zmor_010601 [Zophobas morio]|uniref:Uncharacterized protein n=1 Tax=Zophobas morio TaxID=2755281 RepID=A0AA38IS04_9CUCU|nr:hypothetical protein Zmor_010601 [Zophobas morio]
MHFRQVRNVVIRQHTYVRTRQWQDQRCACIDLCIFDDPGGSKLSYSCLKWQLAALFTRDSHLSLQTGQSTLRKIPLGRPTYHKDIGRDQESSPDQRNIAKRVSGENAEQRRVQKPNAGEAAACTIRDPFLLFIREAACKQVLGGCRIVSAGVVWCFGGEFAGFGCSHVAGPSNFYHQLGVADVCLGVWIN